MRCLVVGGTGFLGGAIVDALVAAGHDITLLARGRMRRSTPEGVGVMAVDRYGDLPMLAGHRFDWVFDTCAFQPVAVERLLDALGDGLGRYVLISSISVYGRFPRAGISEDVPAPEATGKDFAVAQALAPQHRASAFAYGPSYGPLKRSCEMAAQRRLGSRATALRVGLLVGAGDYTDRLTWWVRRLDKAVGERKRVAAPGPPTRAIQMIDARDAAAFAVLCAEQALSGIWNVTGRTMPFSAVFDALKPLTQSEAEIVWVPETAILEAGLQPWTDVPLMGPVDPAFAGFLQVDAERAHAAGLSPRPLAETLVPLLAWDRARRDQPLKGGMTAAQERIVLERERGHRSVRSPASAGS